jgi:6-pyruvoyltetrahydropterin/6-carboxytetrahydropterin synthase
MSGHTRIKVFRAEHHFASAHFLVEMGKCERLHGHNYQVTVELAGRLGPDNTIVDFHTLNPLITTLCNELDHRILIAAHDPRQTIVVTDDEIEVRFAAKRFLFPRSDTLILPLTATTVEKMAAWLADRLAATLAPTLPHVDTIEVGVQEGTAQMALYQRPLQG